MDEWQKVMQGLRSFRCEKLRFVRTNRSIPSTTEYNGSAAGQKPNLLRLRLEPRVLSGRGVVSYVCDGQTAYEYDSAARFVLECPPGFILGGYGSVWDLTTEKGRCDHSLDFPSVWNIVFGNLPPRELTRRFDVVLTREDENYVYLTMTPHDPRDRTTLANLTVVLYGPHHPTSAYLPAVVRLLRPGGAVQEE